MVLSADQPWIVGVLNVTPDSFSDGGCYVEAAVALEAAQQMVRDGAHFIEVGAEATGPSSAPISAEEEIARLRPILPSLCASYAVSVDTYHATTARYAIESGARMINDVSALRADPEMAEVLAGAECLVAIMHAKDAPLPHVTPREMHYRDVVGQIAEFFRERLHYAEQSGITRSRIVIDPGMGRFVSHEARYSWELLRRLDEFKQLGLDQPIMIGTSRKGFLGGRLEERDPLSQLSAIAAVDNGASFVRTHNPKMFAEFLRIWRLATKKD